MPGLRRACHARTSQRRAGIISRNKPPRITLDNARIEHEQRARAKRRHGNGRDAVVGVGAPVDLAPPHQHAREIGQQCRNRHDRHGFLRPEREHQHRHQHDGRAEADDAGKRARKQPEREHAQPDHAASPTRSRIGPSPSAIIMKSTLLCDTLRRNRKLFPFLRPRDPRECRMSSRDATIALRRFGLGARSGEIRAHCRRSARICAAVADPRRRRDDQRCCT